VTYLTTSTDPTTRYRHRYVHGISELAHLDADDRRRRGHVDVTVVEWDGGAVVDVEKVEDTQCP